MRSKKAVRNRGGPGSRGSSAPGSRAVSEDLEPELTSNSSEQSDEEDNHGIMTKSVCLYWKATVLYGV